jgi:hypothetical protein
MLRRTEFTMNIKLVIAVAFSALVTLTPAKVQAAEVLSGKDIIYPGTTAPLSAFMRAGRTTDGTVSVDAWEVHGGEVVRNYDIDMTKLMHMIVVSDDLTDFQHVHPTLLRNGHFTIVVHLAEPVGAYHIYLDGRPRGSGRNVFRFDLPAKAGAPSAIRQIHAAGSSVQVGPYVVTIDPTSVPIGEIATISVRIFENGRPAKDLHPYLGVMSHGVLIGTKDLAYLHVHGMTAEMLDMSSGANDCGDSMMMQMTPMPPNLNIGNEFEFDVLAPSSQDYNLWLQFIGGKTLYTAPLLVTTR